MGERWGGDCPDFFYANFSGHHESSSYGLEDFLFAKKQTDGGSMSSEKANVQQNVVYCPVTISAESLPVLFKAGMTVRITVVTSQKRRCTDPTVSIMSRQGDFYANVLENRQIHH